MPLPRFVSASVCLVEMDTPSRPYPLPKPACSISQAALTLTVPSGPGHPGGSPARARSASYPAASSTGLVKNEPVDHVSWSSASRTIPLPARSFSTADRASASGTRSPAPTPRVRASSAYLTGTESGETASEKSTDSTTNRSLYLKTLVRYANPQSAGATLTRSSRSRSYTCTATIVSRTSWP